MIQYIPKSDLVAEIEKQLKETTCRCDFHDGMRSGYASVIEIINTLEVKEVDLEKEIREYLSTYWPNEKELHPFLGHIAKHFFGLGLRMQTETNITFKYNIGDSVREYKEQKEK